MADEILRLKGVVDLDMSSFQKDIQKAKTSLASIGNVAKDLGQKMSVAITLPIVALGTEIVKTAGNFQSSLNSIGAVLQPTTKEMESLTAKAKELGATTKFSATEAADAILVLGKNGLATNQILGGTLDATLALSSSLKSDLAPTADLLTDVMNQFKISAENVNGSVDDLVGTTIASKFGFEDLKLAYAQAGAVAASVGVDFNDFNAVLAATSSAFASGSDAGTSLKTFLTQLANPTKEAKELMAKLGFTAYDAQGNLLSFAQIEKNLEQSFAGLTEESKAQAAAILFGSDAMRTALTLAETGGKTISDYAAQIDKVNASQVAAAQNKGFEGAIKSLQSAFEALQIAIADTGLLDKVTDMANAMADLLRNMSGLDKSILAAGVAMAAFAAAVGPVLVGFGFLTTTILPLFTAGVGALSAPILVAVAAIAALAAVIYTNWDSIQKQLSELGFLDTVKAAFEDMKNVVVSIFSGLTAILQGLWFVFGKNILSGAVGLLNDLAQIFRSVTGLFSNLVDSVKRLFQGDFKGAFTSLVKSVGSVLDIVVQLGVTAINTVLRLINTFVGSIPIVGDAIRNVMSGVSNFGKSFSDKLDSMGESAKNTAKEISVLKTGIDAANSLGLPTVGNNQGTQAPSLIVKPTKQTETPQLPNVSLNVDGEKKATADLEKEYEKRRRAANEMYNFNVNIAQQMKALTSESILGGLPKIEMPKLEADFGSSVLTQMNAELDLAVQKSLALGDAFNLASAQSSIMQSAISELIENGYSPQSMAVQSIVEQMNSLASASNLVNESFMSAAQASIEAAAAAIQSGDSFGTAAKKIIKAFIAQGVAAAISNTLKIQGGALGLLAVPLAGLAAAGASALFDSLIPKFADGGIVSGKTLAMVGEYAGASSNPEVIAPLDKLKSLIGQNEGSGQIEIFGQLSGENINISNKRYAQNAFYR